MKRADLACIAVTAFIVLGLAPAARADIGVVVTGEATLQPQLASQLEGWLRERGHVVQPSSLEPDAINTLIDCFVIDDLSCARAVVDKRARTQTILFARIEMTANQTDGSRDIAISGYWLAKGHDTLQERRTCRRCTEKMMRATADDLMLALAAEPPTAKAPAGATTIAAPTTVAQAEPSGMVATTTPQTDESHASKLVPIAITAVGGVALVGGVVMIATGGPPSSTTQPNYRDYRTPGYVVAGAGVVAAGVGLYLLLRPDATSAPVAAIGHGGAVVGWTGRF
ncbi:MAG TPA: hypothetical protein VGL61_31115 [Kofleriaceae bacterium]|jgi:hypothetical protein